MGFIKKKKFVIILLLSLIIVCLSAHSFYKDKFLNNVYINNISVGGLNVDKAVEKVDLANGWTQLVIKSQNEELVTIERKDIDYKLTNKKDFEELLESQSNNWIKAFFVNDENYSVKMNYSYNDEKLLSKISEIKELENKFTEAGLEYSVDSNSFKITPDKYEIQLTKEVLLGLAKNKIDKNESQLNIEENIKRPTLKAKDQKMINIKEKANDLLKLELTYDFGDRQEVLNSETFKDWVIIENNELSINKNKAREYLNSLGNKYDTFGKPRTFKTSNGNTIQTNGGSYGWLIHRGKSVEALKEHILKGENKKIEPVYSYKALIRSQDDIGNSYVEIDIQNQMVYVYRNGELKVKTPTVTGNIAKGHQTPTGVYPVNYKQKDTVLKGQGYASPVKYWIPFNGGIGLHDANWRSNFGGNIYKTSGSHGCINLPPNNAKIIYDLVYPGMPVIVH